MDTDRVVSLGQRKMTNRLREFRFDANSSDRDTSSSKFHKIMTFNLEKVERGEEEEEGSEEAIAIVCCKGFKLASLRNSSFSRFGNRGMEIRLGQLQICKEERRGNEGNVW